MSKAQDARKKERENDIATLMRMPQFRRLLADLWTDVRLFEDVMTDGEHNREYLLGARSVGIKLWHMAKRNDGANHITVLREMDSELKNQPKEEDDNE